MRYFILVPDGAGDREIEELNGRTPLEAADISNINEMAKKSLVGMVKTIPQGIYPGSDAANLSVMGYDPSVYLTGRSPLEAASIGIDMSPTDVSFRTNIITLERADGTPAQAGDCYEDLIIKDHASGDITTEEADQLIKLMNEQFADAQLQFYTGVSFRHCMIVHNGSVAYELTPPHDVLTQRAGDHLPKGEGSGFIEDMMRRSFELLVDHPINVSRRERGLNPANSLWIWGQGTRPALPPIAEKYGVTGAAISAVDLIKGIGIFAGLDTVDVEGATGTLHTNYEGKATAAIRQFAKGKDFVYIHVEGPDESSHQGRLEDKLLCLENIDRKVFKPVFDFLKSMGEDFRVLVVPDHRTPLCIRTHASEPVPFVLYDSTQELPFHASKAFSEKAGEQSGTFFASGHELADYFFAKTE